MSNNSQPFILGINSSPHKNGHTASLLKRAIEEINKLGAATRIVHLTDYKILPHSGQLDPDITIEDTADDMPELQKLVLSADGIIFASPTHWFAPSSLMKLFLDRLTSLEVGGFLLEGKVVGIIAYGPEGGALNNAMLMAMIVNQHGMIVPPYCAIFDEGREDEWLKREYEVLAKNIVQQIETNKKLGLHWGYPEEH